MRLSARGKPGEPRIHGTSRRLKAAKCALYAAHLSLLDAHRPLPARSTNWANRWTPTDLFDRTFVVAHAERTRGALLPPSVFRLPPSHLPTFPVLSSRTPLGPFRGPDRSIPESDVDVGCRLRSGIADSNDYLAPILSVVLLLPALCPVCVFPTSVVSLLMVL